MAVVHSRGILALPAKASFLVLRQGLGGETWGGVRGQQGARSSQQALVPFEHSQWAGVDQLSLLSSPI